MKKSRVLTLGLACFFTAVTAFSAVAATSGGGLYSHLNDTSHAQNVSTQQFSQPDEKAAHDAAILSGEGLGLDPENDPVLGTTEGGLEIKFHAKSLTGLWDYNKFTSTYLTDKFAGSGNFANLTGYLYVTMGGYNWVVIGRNSSLNSISLTTTYAQGTATPAEFVKFKDYSSSASMLNSQRETSTPAGSSINSSNSKQILNTVSGVTRTYSITLSSYGAVGASEIPSGCVLCFCEKSIKEGIWEADHSNVYETITFYDEHSFNMVDGHFVGNSYAVSDIKNTMDTLYSSELGFTSAEKSKIQSVTLNTNHILTYYYGAEERTKTNTTTGYLFPLASASSSESFYIGTYLTTEAKRVSSDNSDYWTRSGGRYNAYQAYCQHTCVSSSGSDYVRYCDLKSGMRPAMVIKI